MQSSIKDHENNLSYFWVEFYKKQQTEKKLLGKYTIPWSLNKLSVNI